MTLQTFRDTIRKASPPWLQRGRAERILYAIGLHIDALADAAVAALRHRFPGHYSYESLPIIGRERRIARGRLEDDDTYAARLRRWRIDHRLRGGPYALLAQLHAHYAPDAFPIELISYSGRRYTLDPATGAVTIDDVEWSPDTDSARWARWWLFYYTARWGTEPSVDELADIRLIPRQWIAGHCIGTIILIPTGVELWNWPLGHVWNESGQWNTAGGTAITIPVEQ